MSTTGFRRAETVMLTSSAAAQAEKEWPFTVALVPLRYLFVDPQYQRPRQETFIRKATAQFDPSLVGVIDVAERGQRFAVLDGQQRMAIMENVGKMAGWCAVYSGMTLRDEAEFFWKKNDERKNMTPYYKFRARVVAQEPKAARVLAVVHGCGFDISPTTNDSELIGSVKALEDVYGYRSESRQESLTPTLITIREAFLGRERSTNGEVIRGLGRFWAGYADDEVDSARLVGVLAELGPVQLLRTAHDLMYRQGSSRGYQIAQVIADEYNKGARKGKLDLRRISQK